MNDSPSRKGMKLELVENKGIGKSIELN